MEPGGVGTTRAWDWGDKASVGEQYAVAGRSGSWLAVWFGGQKAWLHDPRGKHHATIPGNGTLITPKAGLASIPVYGRAYPSSISTATLDQYSIPAGQTYVAKDLVTADYYSASTYNDPSVVPPRTRARSSSTRSSTTTGSRTSGRTMSTWCVELMLLGR